MGSYKWFINVISEDLGKMLFNLCNKSIVLHSLSFFYVIFDYSNIVLKFFCETWLAIVSLMINIFISASKYELFGLFRRTKMKALFQRECTNVILHRSLQNCSTKLFGSPTTENKEVSSANNFGFHWRFSGKSLI